VKWSRFVIIITSSFLSAAVYADLFDNQPNQTFLPVDEAFRVYIQVVDNKATLNWQIAPGYYLYQHRTSVSGEDNKPVSVRMPEGQPKTDEYFGDVVVYYDHLNVDLPTKMRGNTEKNWLSSEKVQIGYQGCADQGLCYPPQQRTFNILPNKDDIFLPAGNFE